MLSPLRLCCLIACGLGLATACDSSMKTDTAETDTAETETGTHDTAPDTGDPPDTGGTTVAFEASLETTLTSQGLDSATEFFASTTFNADVALYQLVGAASVYLRGGLYRIGLDQPMGMPIEPDGFDPPPCWTVVENNLGGLPEPGNQTQFEYDVSLNECALDEASGITLSGDFTLEGDKSLDMVELIGTIEGITVSHTSLPDVSASLEGTLEWQDAENDDVPDTSSFDIFASFQDERFSRDIAIESAFIDFDTIDSGDMGAVMVFASAIQSICDGDGSPCADAKFSAGEGVYASEAEFDGILEGTIQLQRPSDKKGESELELTEVVISRDADLTAASLGAWWAAEKGSGWQEDTFQLQDVSMEWESLDPSFTGSLVIDWRRHRYDDADEPYTVVIHNDSPDDLAISGDGESYTLEGIMGLMYTFGDSTKKGKGNFAPDELYELTLHALRLGIEEPLPDQGHVIISTNLSSEAGKEEETGAKEGEQITLYEYHFAEATPQTGWSIMIEHLYDDGEATATYYCNDLLSGTLEPLSKLRDKERPSEGAPWNIGVLCAEFDK